MKANLKKITTALTLIATMSFSSIAFAEEIALPVVTKPAALEEGTQRELTPAQIAELLPWAKNSKVFLVDLLASVQNIPSTDQVERLVDGVKSVVLESAPKNSELLMRYALNRSLVLNETLSKEMGADEVGTVDAKIRVLKLSIEMALKSYDADVNTISKKAPTDFVAFGIGYFNFLTELNKSIFDASAQYHIQRISLEWLQWDLYRDLNNASYASQIVKINNSLKIFPNAVKSDRVALANIKQMKLVASQLSLESVKKIRKDESSGNNGNAASTSDGSYKGASDGRCYPYDSKTGYLLTSKSVDNSYCSQGNYRGASDGKCYGYDTRSGYLLTSQSVDNSYCSQNNYRAASDGRCYGYDTKSGYLLSSKSVDKSYCTNEYRGASDGKCYGYDTRTGYSLTSQSVDVAYCTKEHRGASDGKCYGYDTQSRYLLSSKAIDVSYCSNDNYKVASDGRCYGYDSKSGYVLTSKTVDASYCSK